MKTSCGCAGCSAGGAPPIENAPGLSALAYRIGTYASFFAAMKARLRAGDLKTGQAAPPLRKLKTHSQDDPAIALLDVWAILADVLTFYQERIANEGYLRTATERQSIVNLAALVGYRLRPGVAASSFVAYTVDPTAENTLILTGSKIQSVSAATGELPQTFETVQDLLASGAYSDLAPRLARPQLLSSDLSALYLNGTTNNVNQNDPLLVVASPPVVRRVLDVAMDAKGSRTTVTFQPLAGQAANEPTANAAAPAGDSAAKSAAGTSAFSPLDMASALLTPLQKAPASHPASAANLEARTSDVFQPEVDTGPRIIRSMHPAAADLYSALANSQVAPEPSGACFAFRVIAPVYGHNAPPKPITNSKGIVVGTEEWPMGDSLAITIAIDPPSTSFRAGGEMFKAARQQSIQAFMSISQGSTSASGTFKIPGTGQKIGNWELEINVSSGEVPHVTIKIAALDRFYIMGIESETVFQVKTDGPTLDIPIGLSASADQNGRHLFVDTASGLLLSDIAPSAPDPNVIALDSVYDKILPGSWVYIERADLDPGKQKAPTTVASVSQVSLNRFGVPARVTQLRLTDGWLDPSDRLLSVARNATVYAQSEKLPIAEEPISDDIANDSIELDELYSDLDPGRWLIVSGERTDIPNVTGINGSELVMLASVKQSLQKLPIVTAPASSSGTGSADPAAAPSATGVPPPAPAPRPGEKLHSFLQLAHPLAYSYKRGSVTVYGNVVPVTHGETHNEVLGSGDTSQPFQQFKLHGTPLTYVSGASTSGAASTLSIFVNGIEWREIASLTTAGPQDRVFVTSMDDQNIVTVTFGDGVHGARPPSGAENITARYRVGLGSGGNLDARRLTMLSTRPLGVRAVTNPVAADGGANRDSAADGRRNTPLAAIALNRLVSVSDYAAFTRTFAGMGKASSGLFPIRGLSTVLVSVAGAQGALLHPESPLLVQLHEAMRQFGDPHLPVAILPIDPLVLVLSARVQLQPAFQWSSVKPEIVAALRERFNFEARELGRPVFSSSIIAAVQNVPGVARCVLDVLDSISRSDFENIEQLKNRFDALRSAPRVRESIPIRLEHVDKHGNPHASELAYLDPELPETLLLNEIPS